MVFLASLYQLVHYIGNNFLKSCRDESNLLGSKCFQSQTCIKRVNIMEILKTLNSLFFPQMQRGCGLGRDITCETEKATHLQTFWRIPLSTKRIRKEDKLSLSRSLRPKKHNPQGTFCLVMQIEHSTF